MLARDAISPLLYSFLISYIRRSLLTNKVISTLLQDKKILLAEVPDLKLRWAKAVRSTRSCASLVGVGFRASIQGNCISPPEGRRGPH